ncbi:B12-binding domain-containing radical SAM protein [Pseudonocardia sp. TMWB2A]|uniref:B12-binding domain-containing radical SAM protein n=1 Tax=Pseudonocardia sp. TMWB2A TaxID=687430 RepID=UPI00307D71A6
MVHDVYADYRCSDRTFKVALVHPYLVEAWQKNRLKYRESLALGYLTAALERHEFDVTVINAELLSLGPEQVAERILADPQIGLLGISAKSQRTYRAARQIAAAVKHQRPDMHITLGGVFPSAADTHIIEADPNVDSIVRGEGEHAIVELAARLVEHQPLTDMRGLTLRRDGATLRTPPRPRIRDLDGLAFPARRDLQHMIAADSSGATSAYLVASRGCYAACTFCSIHQIYGDHNVARRSPQSIADEMQHVIDTYGISRFSFVDDLFIMPSKSGIRWVHEFCDVITERDLDIRFYAEMRADTIDRDLVGRLVDVGMHRLFIGVESGVDSVLERWDKGTTSADNENALSELRGIGLKPHQINFGYIMFDPEMTYDELKRQYFWIKGSGYAKVQHLQNKMNIYWGTPQYRKMIAQGRTDTAPLGDRWQYEFDDPRVGAVEKLVRAFHRRYEEAPAALAVLNARESFMKEIREDSSTSPLPKPLFEATSLAMCRVDQLERDCYYFVFENLFVRIDGGDQVDETVLDLLWNDLSPGLEALHAEADLLAGLAGRLHQLTIRSNAEDAPTTPGTAWFDGSGRLIVWVSEAGALHGYRFRLGMTKTDRYDHDSDALVMSSGSGVPEITVVRGANPFDTAATTVR